MLRSHRYFILALVGLTLSGAKQAAQHHQPANEHTEANEAQEAPPYRPYPQRYSDACYKAENHDTADLCAQWRAAVAAEKAADEARLATIAAIVGTILTLITVVGLTVTIWQTNGALAEARRGNRLNLLFERRARKESRKADADQARALELAAAQVDVAQDTARRQLRPYVGVQGSVFSPPGTLPAAGFHITWKNYGQTPATNLHIVYSIGYGTSPYTAEVVDAVEWQHVSTRNHIDIPPSQTASSFIPFSDDQRSLIIDIMNGTTPRDALCNASVSYDDGFGIRRNTLVIISSERQQMPRMEAGVAYSRGD